MFIMMILVAFDYDVAYHHLNIWFCQTSICCRRDCLLWLSPSVCHRLVFSFGNKIQLVL